MVFEGFNNNARAILISMEVLIIEKRFSKMIIELGHL
jgi:hypothetical protein